MAKNSSVGIDDCIDLEKCTQLSSLRELNEIGYRKMSWVVHLSPCFFFFPSSLAFLCASCDCPSIVKTYWIICVAGQKLYVWHFSLEPAITVHNDVTYFAYIRLRVVEVTHSQPDSARRSLIPTQKTAAGISDFLHFSNHKFQILSTKKRVYVIMPMGGFIHRDRLSLWGLFKSPDLKSVSAPCTDTKWGQLCSSFGNFVCKLFSSLVRFVF